MNHWIDRFPPSPSDARKVSDRRKLLRRARSCRTRFGRAPNLIAVDFYRRSGVLAAAPV